ncbi:Annexin-B10 [Dactylellina cionopaga]|nr:Annexin-B10 [Dactylellina cionopaga]
MSYPQYPGGYGAPGGPPPPGQYGYPPPNNYGGPQGYPPGPSPGPPPQQSFPPPQHQGSYHQPGGSANAYFNPSAQPTPPPGGYGGQPAYGGQIPQPGYPQPDYNASRASYNAPPVPPHPNAGQHPPGPNQYPPGGGYGGPPPNQYQQPLYNNFGGPPPPNQYGQYAGQPPPQQQPYPPQQYAAHPSGPSPGFEDPPQCNPLEYSKQADYLRKAMKGMGTNESELIRVIAGLKTAFAVHSVQRAFSQRHQRDLIKDIKSETSGRFEDVLVAVARGPLLEEVYALHDAIHRPGTTESTLNDVLLCRSPPDLDAIKKAYKRTFSRDLETDVRGDLSMKTENMFTFVLQNRRSEETAPADSGQAEKDAYNIQMAMEGVGGAGIGGMFGGTHQDAVYSTILSRNDAQIGLIAYSYERMYSRRLEGMIEKKFSGHMQTALLYAVRGGTDKARRDAMLLEDAMHGVGTKDALLIHRIVKYHWNKPHFENVKRAYQELYRKSLEDRVYGETSGDYRKFLIALIVQS